MFYSSAFLGPPRLETQGLFQAIGIAQMDLEFLGNHLDRNAFREHGFDLVRPGGFERRGGEDESGAHLFEAHTAIPGEGVCY